MAYGICDVPLCKSETYMGWRPLSAPQRFGKQICRTHFDRHKDKSDTFSLYDVFGFKRPPTKLKTVKLKDYCSCGRERQPGHRLCKNCATERERDRKREYYHQSKEEKPPKVISLRCKDCGNEREPSHRYCGKCGQRRSKKSNRERQRRHYKKIRFAVTA